MKIEIIGSGCPTCHKLHEMVVKLKNDGKIKAEIEYSNDINKLIELGVMSSPALIIDGKIINSTIPKKEEQLLEIINTATSKTPTS